MKISKVLSYRNAWHQFIAENKLELDDILRALPLFIQEYAETREQSNRPYFRELWEQKLLDFDWVKIERTFYSDSGLRINIGGIGPVKNNISATISFGHPD